MESENFGFPFDVDTEFLGLRDVLGGGGPIGGDRVLFQRSFSFFTGRVGSGRVGTGRGIRTVVASAMRLRSLLYLDFLLAPLTVGGADAFAFVPAGVVSTSASHAFGFCNSLDIGA